MSKTRETPCTRCNGTGFLQMTGRERQTCLDCRGAGKASATRETTIDRAKRENAEADARLIAAAPEMYAALKQIAAGMGNLSLEMIGPEGVSGPNDGKARAIYLEDFVKLAREVVGRIEGMTPRDPTTAADASR